MTGITCVPNGKAKHIFYCTPQKGNLQGPHFSVGQQEKSPAGTNALSFNAWFKDFQSCDTSSYNALLPSPNSRASILQDRLADQERERSRRARKREAGNRGWDERINQTEILKSLKT